MDSTVSAFAVYKSNKQSNKNKKTKKKKSKVSPDKVSTKIKEETVIYAAQKLKKQLKDSKLTKKKLHKKKKSNHLIVSDKTKVVKRNRNVSEDEEIPILVPAIPNADAAVYIANNHQPILQLQKGNDSSDFTPVVTDSVEEGLKVFKWMIAPYNPDVFLTTIWETKPLHISRRKPQYYKKIISTPIIDGILRNDTVQFTKNIDVTTYENGKRKTHNPEGRAHPSMVWDFYLRGCSIRLLNPQTYIPKLHALNATLQEFFNSFVGANAYLTPPDSQGFAPHYDDIEAFILQVEGKKLWRIYKPRSEKEVLPRVSSKNFNQDEIGKPIMELILEAGDMLYFPRGYIHQGVTLNGEHSLHITISMYQKHSWADFFEKLFPAALQIAITETVELRHGLPLDIYDNFGLVHSDSNNPRRTEVVNFISSLYDKIKEYLPIDDAIDQMNKNYQYDALPPVLSECEKDVTVFGNTNVMTDNGIVRDRVEMNLDTRIRLLRKNILRMVAEEEKIRLYYYVENSLEYHGNELSFIEIESNFAPAVETLIMAYPQYVPVENLQLATSEEKIQLADALWVRGLIMTEYPLEIIDD